MSFPKIENQLRNIKQEIQEINQSIKGLIIHLQLITSSFERILNQYKKEKIFPWK